MSVGVLLRDKFGKQIGHRVAGDDADLTQFMEDNRIFDRVGVEDKVIVMLERCDTCGKAGHEPDCYELQHTGN